MPKTVTPADLALPFYRMHLGWQLQRASEQAVAHYQESDEVNTVDQLPSLFSGRISQQGEVDRVRIVVAKGTKYRAKVNARECGMLLDSVLRVVHPKDGEEVARNDDQSRNKYDASVDFSAKEDGVLELQISDLVDGFGMRYAYTVELEVIEPSVGLTVAADHFAMPGGEDLEIPITVSRVSGYSSKLKITATGLPEGVSCEAVVSEAKGDSSKLATLKMTASDNVSHQGAFQISAVALGDDEMPVGKPVTATYALRDEVEIRDVWLTVTPKSGKATD